MKILIPTSSYPVKGHPSWAPFIRETAQAIADKGHEVTILVFSPDNRNREYAEPGNPAVRIVEYSYKPWGKAYLHSASGIMPSLATSLRAWLDLPFYFLSSGLHLIKAVRKYQINLIHAMWYLPMGLIAAVLKPFHKKPLVVTGLGADLHLPVNPLMCFLIQYVFCRTEMNIVCSHYLGERAQEYGIQPGKYCVISNGIRMNRFYPAKKKDGKHTLKIGCAKRLVSEKNVEDLVRAVSQLSPSDREQIEVVIAGSGPRKEYIQNEIDNLGLNDSVHLVGELAHEKMPEFFRKLDIYVDTSTQEGIANSNIEAVASGCVIIATDGFGNRDLIESGKNGILFPPRNVRCLANALSCLIADRAYRRQLAKEAGQIKKESFDVNFIAEKINERYRIAVSV